MSDDNGDELEFDGSWFGIVDASAEELHVPLGGNLEPLVVPQPRDDSLCTSRFVWDSAIFMCRVLASGVLEPTRGQHYEEEGRRLRTVELGTGTGICAAALGRWSSASGCAAQILATDLPEAIWLAGQTMSVNGLDGIVDVAALDWQRRDGDDDAWRRLDEADVVFGADVTYSDVLLDLVLGVVRRPCSSGSVALLCHEHRGSKAEFERDLTEGLRGSGVSWVELPENLPEWCSAAPAGGDGGPSSGADAASDKTTQAEDRGVYMLAVPNACVLGETGLLSRLGAIATNLQWHP